MQEGRTSIVQCGKEHPASAISCSRTKAHTAAKIIGEELLRAAHSLGQDVAALRLFNVYGPHMDPTLHEGAFIVSSRIFII